MTAEEYLAQNALGFEGDTFLKEEVERLVKKWEVVSIIESGTYMGATSRELAKMAEHVFTIEINPPYYLQAREVQCEKSPVYLLGNSSEIIGGQFIVQSKFGNVFLLLDAHWQQYNPLIDELEVIAKARRGANTNCKVIIAIHDFKVPDHPELGYDTYAGQDYEWSWIEQSIKNIYGEDGFTYHYNSEAAGAKRGVIFIEPK